MGVKESRVRKRCEDHPSHFWLLDQSHCSNPDCKAPAETNYLAEMPLPHGYVPSKVNKLQLELPGPWTSRRTSPPSSRFLLPTLRLSLTSCPRVTRSLLTLRLSRMSSRGSPTMSRSSRVTPRLSATSTPTMSSTGPSTGPASRSSTPGWLVLRSLPLRVFPSPPTWLRSRLLTTRSRHSRRTALTSSRSLRLPMELPRR